MAQRLSRALSAAVHALEGHGRHWLDGAARSPTPDDFVALRIGTAVLLALPAAGLLVRVDDRVGAARAARHLAVGRALAGLGVPAVRPLPDQEAPVVVDGVAVTLWQLERLVVGAVGPAVVGHLAGRLHRASLLTHGDASRLGDDGLGVERFDPLRDVDEQLGIAELADDEAALMGELAAEVGARWQADVVADGGAGAGTEGVGPWGIVHGDLHAGNVLLTRRGPVLADLELAGVGPVAYDLAAPVVAVLRYGAGAGGLAAYARAYRAPIPRSARHGVLRDAYELWLTSWALANRHLDGAHALEAARRLARWREPQRARDWSLR